MAAPEELIRQVPLFADLDKKDLQGLASTMKERQFNAGDTIAACPVPVVSAVGHEQDTPLSDLVADARASTPTAAARLVVPDLAELTARLERSRTALATGARRALERERRRLDVSRDHLRRAPLLLVERRRAAVEHSAGRLRALSPRATLDRGYAIVRTAGSIVRSSSEVATGTQVDVELGTGGFGATVEDTR